MKIKKQNGITLIALIVTIIVLIILAGVSISLVFGENGIVSKSKYSSEEYKKEQIREQVEMGIANINIQKIENGEILTVEQALIELNDENIFEEIDLANNEGTTEGYKVQLGYNEKGAVIIIDIQKDNGAQIKVTLEPSGYTNQNIIATIEVKTNKDSVTELKVPEEIEKREDGKYEISKNGTYIIRAILSSGIVVEKELKIESIDKNAPKAFEIKTNVEDGILNIEAKTQDEEADENNVQSGIDRYEYIVIDENNNKTIYNTNKIEGLKSGKYKVYTIAYDKAKNSTTTETIEVEIKIPVKFSKVSAGSYFSLAIDTEGNLWSWGHNNKGQLGDGTTTDKTTPIQIAIGTKFKEISAGEEYCLAIDTDGNLYGWGYQKYGLGDGSTYKKIPTFLEIDQKFTKVLAGEYTSSAIDTSGNLYTWGYFALVNKTTTYNITIPTRVESNTQFVQTSMPRMTASNTLIFSIDINGNLWGCGTNSTYGELGNSTLPQSQKTLALLKSTEKFKQVASGGWTSFSAIDINGNLWGWGRNAFGEIGDGTTTTRTNMIKVNTETKYTNISAGEYHRLAIDERGNLWAWGSNSSGQLGDGTTAQKTTPVQITSGTKFKEISAGSNHSMAIDENGNLWTWGSNSSGQLGDGTTANKLVPTKIEIVK